MGKEGHCTGLWHIVIVKSLCWRLWEHTVVPEVMAHTLVRRTVEHLQERMTCRETQLEGWAEDMRDPVNKGSRDDVDQVQPAGHHDGRAPPARLATMAVEGHWRRGSTSGRWTKGAPDGEQTEEGAASRRALEKRSHKWVTTWARPSKTARVRLGK